MYFTAVVQARRKPPVSLACGHTVCRPCLESLQRRQCPFDQSFISVELASLPVNTALLQLIGTDHKTAWHTDNQQQVNHSLNIHSITDHRANQSTPQ